MKKTLVALAALASVSAFAQSSVTIDGVVDAGYQAINYKGTKTSGIEKNGTDTSQINIRVTQDLGSGLKANFRMENDISTASNKYNTGSAASVISNSNTPTGTQTGTQQSSGTAGAFGNGELRVGLEGGFGRVDAGAVNFNGLGTILTGQPYGTNIGGGYGSVLLVSGSNGTAPAAAVRDENSVKFTSPTFSGLNATLYKSNKQTSAITSAASAASGLTSQGSVYSTTNFAYQRQGSQEIGLNYANGPLAVSFSNLTQDWNGVAQANGGAAKAYKNKFNTLGANYTINAFKVFFINQTVKSDDATPTFDQKYHALTGQYTVGAIDLFASSGKYTKNSNGKTSDLTALGANYNLSLIHI